MPAVPAAAMHMGSRRCGSARQPRGEARIERQDLTITYMYNCIMHACKSRGEVEILQMLYDIFDSVK